MAAGLKSIMSLSFVLAIGFLLIILSCALYKNWFPLLVAMTFVIAPLPNAVCSRFSQADDLISDDDNSSSAVGFGQYMTGFLVVTGLALPSVLTHCEIIMKQAGIMSICGGLLVYGTIIAYSHFFSQQAEEF